MKPELATLALALTIGTGPAMATSDTIKTDTTPAAPAPAGGASQGFDRDAWVAAAGKADQSGPRFDLIGAAIAQIPAGTAQADVLARLGDPDQRFDGAWAYMAGPTLFGGEYAAVLVRFDAQGRVVDARQVSSETWQ